MAIAKAAVVRPQASLIKFSGDVDKFIEITKLKVAITHSSHLLKVMSKLRLQKTLSAPYIKIRIRESLRKLIFRFISGF